MSFHKNYKNYIKIRYKDADEIPLFILDLFKIKPLDRLLYISSFRQKVEEKKLDINLDYVFVMNSSESEIYVPNSFDNIRVLTDIND